MRMLQKIGEKKDLNHFLRSTQFYPVKGNLLTNTLLTSIKRLLNPLPDEVDFNPAWRTKEESLFCNFTRRCQPTSDFVRLWRINRIIWINRTLS